MIFLDDGKVSISFETHGGTIRWMPELPSEAKPAYEGSGEVTAITDSVVKLHAFSGEGLTRRHLRLIAQLLLSEGFSVAYVDRRLGHSLPKAERVGEGDFAGMWRVDLASLRLAPKHEFLGSPVDVPRR